MKLAPDRKKFMDVISGSNDIKADMEAFCTNFSPFLEENHKFLVCPVCCGVDDLLAPKYKCLLKMVQFGLFLEQTFFLMIGIRSLMGEGIKYLFFYNQALSCSVINLAL